VIVSIRPSMTSKLQPTSRRHHGLARSAAKASSRSLIALSALIFASELGLLGG
jgi:hypothetical protein